MIDKTQNGQASTEIKVAKQKRFDYDNAETLLEVKHLEQYFKFKRGPEKYLKAVHDISFDVKKGEVFGLVGESGCGKTTTGRSIIKLYNITSGDIKIDGIRISAGTRWNQKEIKYVNMRLNKKLKDLKEDERKKLELLKEEYQKTYSASFNYHILKLLIDSGKKIDQIDDKKKFIKKYDDILENTQLEMQKEKEKANRICSVQRKEIRKAKYDNKYYNKNIQLAEVKKVEDKYQKIADENPDHNLTKEQEVNKEQELKRAKSTTVTSKIQMIFQDPIASLNPRMTVRDIISEGLVIRGGYSKEYINDEVERVLQLVGLVPEHANRYPHEFSGGQRQRIGIARSVIMNPELIVADEPVSALDVSIQAQVINLLNDLRNELGLTIIFIAHNLSVVKYFCDRIAVMYFGRLVEIATSDELFAHPLHPYTISLLSAVPYPDPSIEKSRTRIKYNPKESHDYSKQKPTMREIAAGHFVYCNDEEEKKYLKQLSEGKSIYAK